ncbi:MAG: DMT family transporter [Fimbriimonadaceae bacterium]
MRFWPRWFPHPALVVVVVAWGLNFSIIKVILDELEPSVVALVRYVVMLPTMWLWCKVLRIELKYPPGQLWKFLFAGFMANGVYMVFFLEGMETASAAQGAILVATMPIWIALLSIFLKLEKFSAHLAVGILLAFAGAAMTILAEGDGGGGSVLGSVLVLVAAFIWAVSVILMRPLVVEGSPFAVFTLTFPGGALVLLPYGAAATWNTDWSSVTPLVWWFLAYLIFIAGVGAFGAYFKGIAEVGATRTSMTQFFIPPVAALFAWSVFGQALLPMQIVGLVVVVAGSLVASGRVFGGRVTAGRGTLR